MPMLGLSQYIYGGNDPINNVDPSGKYLITNRGYSAEWVKLLDDDYGIYAVPRPISSKRVLIYVDPDGNRIELCDRLRKRTK